MQFLFAVKEESVVSKKKARIKTTLKKMEMNYVLQLVTTRYKCNKYNQLTKIKK